MLFWERKLLKGIKKFDNSIFVNMMTLGGVYTLRFALWEEYIRPCSDFANKEVRKLFLEKDF